MLKAVFIQGSLHDVLNELDSNKCSEILSSNATHDLVCKPFLTSCKRHNHSGLETMQIKYIMWWNCCYTVNSVMRNNTKKILLSGS